MRGLRDRSIIVAGGATGIGAATAMRLGEEGAKVTVGDIDLARATATAARIEDAGGTAAAVEFDLTDEDSIKAMVADAVEAFGTVHGLFNVGADLSAGHHGQDLNLLNTDWEVWRHDYDVNVLGYARTSRHVLPILLANGGGAIVNTSSGGAIDSLQTYVAYSASKAAVNALTRHVAKTWGQQGIRCNGVMPGLVVGETQRARNADGSRDAMYQAFLETHPTPRVGAPEDLAATVAFLLSDDAEWVNGQTWSVDGGGHMRQ